MPHRVDQKTKQKMYKKTKVKKKLNVRTISVKIQCVSKNRAATINMT